SPGGKPHEDVEPDAFSEERRVSFRRCLVRFSRGGIEKERVACRPGLPGNSRPSSRVRLAEPPGILFPAIAAFLQSLLENLGRPCDGAISAHRPFRAISNTWNELQSGSPNHCET